MKVLPDSVSPLSQEFMILGLTQDGKQFRPSDWAERLCGVMACFRPAEAGNLNAHLHYSPYVKPVMIDNARAVAVNEELRTLEPLAYHFIVNFAKENDLQIIHACVLPE